jgi:hypothetical protein
MTCYILNILNDDTLACRGVSTLFTPHSEHEVMKTNHTCFTPRNVKLKAEVVPVLQSEPSTDVKQRPKEAPTRAVLIYAISGLRSCSIDGADAVVN